MVLGSIATLKFATIRWLRATPVALFNGSVKTTVGKVVSRLAAVVKVQVKSFTRDVPTMSFAPVVMVPVYTVLIARFAVGVKVAVVPVDPTVPATAVVP